MGLESNFDSWQAFFAMGGYGLYVWPSFALAFLVLGYIMLSPVLQHRQLLRLQARMERRAARAVSAPQPNHSTQDSLQ